MTRSIGSRFLAKPANGPFVAAISALARYAWPHMIAVSAEAIARPRSLSYGTPSCISSEPRFAYPRPSGRYSWLFFAMFAVGYDERSTRISCATKNVRHA